MSENINNEQIEVRDSVESGANTILPNSRKRRTSSSSWWGLRARRRSELARKSSQNIEAARQASTILVKGAQEISREWFQVTQESMAKNIDATSRLTRCRSLQDFRHGSKRHRARSTGSYS